MPDEIRESLCPSLDFRELIEAAVAAIREQMEERLADHDAQNAGLFAERQELRRADERPDGGTDARDEAAALRAELDAEDMAAQIFDSLPPEKADTIITALNQQLGH